MKLVRRSVSNWAYMILALSMAVAGVANADVTPPVIYVDNLNFNVNDGDSALGSVTADETVTWSIAGAGVSINSAGSVTLDSPADYLVKTSHSFDITATDTPGNSRSIQVTVAVNDITSPVLDYSGLVTSIDDGGTALGSIAANEPVDWSISGSGVSINSSGVIALDSPADFLVAESHSFTVSATDKQGGAAVVGYLFIVEVNDITAPVLDYSGLVTSINDGGAALGSMAANEPVDWSISGSGVSISGSGVITLESPADFLVAESHSFTVSATDKQGGAAVVGYLFTVAVNDVTAPIIYVDNLDLNVNDGDSALGSVTADETVTWSIAGAGVSISSAGSVTLDSPADYLVKTSYSFDITATDTSGNFRRIPVTVVVNDITSPVLDYSGLVTSINDGGKALGSMAANEPVDWSISGSGVSINSSGVITLESPADFLVAESHSFTVSATDKQGGAGVVSYLVTIAVNDITAPIFDYSGLLTSVDEGSTALGSISANEPVTWSISGSGVSISSGGVVTLDSPASYEVASSHAYRVSAVDKQAGYGTDGYLFTVAVNDTTAPVITLQGSASITLNVGDVFTDPGATATDNKDGNLTADIVVTGTVDTSKVGTYTLSYNVSDAAGNAATPVTRSVKVVAAVDTVAPVITLLGAASIELEVGAVFTDPGATAIDAVDGDLTADIVVTGTVDTSKVGTYTLSYNVSDAAGNAATPVTRSVKVVAAVAVDTVAPVITLLGDASIEVEVGAVFTDPGATATDAVDGDLTNDIVVTLLDTSAPGINIPANKIGNGPDTTMGTDDDVTVKGSYIAGDLTFVRPPVNLEAPAATWCPTGDGCTAGNSTAKDAVRMGSNLGFRRMQFAEAEAWCAAENGRLPTRAEITTHIMPLVGNGKAFETDLVWPQAKSKYWTADKNEAGDKAFVFTTRNSANDNVVNSVTNTVALVNSPLWVMCVATAAKTVDTSKVGAYTLSYNVSDAAGNAATPVTRSVKVVAAVAVDTVAPVITLLGDASIEVEVGAVFTDPGATATDAVDGDLTADIVVTGTVDTSKVDTYTLSYNVSDAAGNAATPVTRSVKVVAAVAVDTVAPVITLLGAASIELEVGAVFTDPGATATDAVDGDLTADIVVTGTVDTSKVDTYTLSYNVSDAAGNAATSVARTVNVVDAAIPFTLVIPADLTVNAAGFLTAVDLDPEDVASAIYGDGIAIDVVADQLGPFQSGRYEIVWSATNAGLTVTDTQILKVVPMVNLGVDVTTTEGSNLSIDVLLSGQAADYPVSIPFTVSGTAAEGDDYTVGSTGSVIITEGKIASISLSIVADEAAESEENVVITLGEATNAVLGVNTDQVITIVEGNLPPKVTLQISQAGIAGSTIAQNLGVAMINVAIFDANATDTHTVDWAKTLLTLPNATVGVKALEFDAAALAVGVYLVEVDISDGVEIVSVAVNLNVLAQAPVLSADADSDGDGISDADEGYGDSDGDGIPDYLDNIAEPNLIPFGDSGAVVESEPGTQMILGGFALGAGGNNVGISEEYIAALTGIADNSFDYPGGLIDFILTGAEPGYSYTLVVPLSVAIPESAVYRKYSASGGWADFVFSGTNALSTAMSVEGACPALGSDLYTLDLTAGDDCLQMFIADGGANDADGVANGSLFDPGGIAVRDIGIPSSNSQVVLSNTTLKANGTDSTTVTVTALSAEGVGLEFMNVTGSMALVGVVVSDFVEQGSGIYTATVTAGMTSGNGPVTVVIDNGDTSITVSSERLQITAIEKSSSGGGGCTVASNGSSDASLLVLLVLAGLLLARRRYLVR